MKAKKLKESIKKYFVTFRINVKGDRKDVGFVLEDTSEDSALEKARLKVKRDFSGVRSITFANVRVATKDDKDFVNPVIEDKSISVEKDEKPKEVSPLEKLFNTLDGNEIVYKVVFTPGRKPRLRDYDKSFIMLEADSLEDAKKKAEFTFNSMGLEYKSSWCVILEGTLDSFRPSIENRIKSFKDEDIDLSSITDFSPIKVSSKPVPVPEKRELVSLDGLSAKYDDNFVISSVTPDGISFVDSLKFSKYELTLISEEKTFPPIVTFAEDDVSAAAYLFAVIRGKQEFIDVYKGVKIVDSKNLSTGKIMNLKVPPNTI